MILQCADHLQTGAIAYVRQPWVFVAAEMSLQNSSVLGAIKNGAPRFELAQAIGRFLRVQLGHAPLVTALPPSSRCVDVHFILVAIYAVRWGRRLIYLGPYYSCYT